MPSFLQSFSNENQLTEHSLSPDPLLELTHLIHATFWLLDVAITIFMDADIFLQMQKEDPFCRGHPIRLRFCGMPFRNLLRMEWSLLWHSNSSWAGPLYPAPLSPYLYFSAPSPQIFGLTSYFLPCSCSSKHDNILVQGCSHLKPLYLSISLVCWSLLKCHLLGKILFFLLLCLIYCQSFSTKCKLHEGLDLCCVALYPLYLQQCLTHRSGSKHVHWVNG